MTRSSHSRQRRRARSPRSQQQLSAGAGSRPGGGPHELGQNWLVDRRFPAEMAEILRHAPPYPVLELGAGNGAVTRALVAAGFRVTALESDPRCAARLKRLFAGQAAVVEADMLGFEFAAVPHHVVANVPFSLTTPLLRHLVGQEHWDSALLVLQWEVARKRAGIGGTTMFTASWWPWYEFSLCKRVPAAAFAPRPSVDGGILLVRRRKAPPVRASERRSYQDLVRVAFTGAGRELPRILRSRLPETVTRDWMAAEAIGQRALPRDVTAGQWASLHQRRMQARAGSGSRTRRW
jgi:23S rRNA (adenine-N6)-dimethyltransferase